MFRMTTLKIGLCSALATLMLLLAMLASTGTASAHTASCQPPYCTPGPRQPHIAVYNDQWIGNGCKWMLVVGYGFTPGSVALDAYPDWLTNTRLTIQPQFFDADKVGDISGGITICGFGLFGSPYHMADLYGYNYSGWYVTGPYSNDVLV
jgi:hypothetical protein